MSPPSAPHVRIAEGPAHPFGVVRGSAVDVRTWWHCCEADPSATFFSTPDWTEMLADAFPAFRPHPFLFSFGSGMRCVLPAIEVRRALGHLAALHSMPFGTYGGVTGGGFLESADHTQLLAHIGLGALSRFQTTVVPNPLARRPLPARLTNSEGLVHAPRLESGFESWWAQLDPRTRYHIRKAERRGVRIERGFRTQDLEAFAGLHSEASRAWRPPAHFGSRFFRALWERRSERTELWTARLEGRFVAGVLVLRLGTQVTPFLSAVDPTTRSLAPTNLIYARLIRACCEERRTEMNFLGSGGKRGVERFKASMGGEPRRFAYLDARGAVYPLVKNPVANGLRNATRLTRRMGRGRRDRPASYPELTPTP